MASSSQDPSSFGWHAGPMNINTGYSYNGYSFPGGVAIGTEHIWTAMLNDLVPQIPGGLKRGSNWGYEYRGKTGGSGLSFHAYGLALDINADENPNGVSPPDIPGKYQISKSVGNAVAKKYGMEFGGNWNDGMHMEIHMSPAECAAFQTGGVGNTPINLPTPGAGQTDPGAGSAPSGLIGGLFAPFITLAIVAGIGIVGIILVLYVAQ